MSSDPRLDSFENAFDCGHRGFRVQCECGRIFFDGHNCVYDLEEGEFEKLKASAMATQLNYASQALTFEGKEYSADCDCWHGRALRIIGWLEENRNEVAKFLNLEKQRKLNEVNRMEDVEVQP